MSGGARRGSPASLSLLLLAASLLAFAPATLASVPRGAAALSPHSLAADVGALATPPLEHTENVGFRVFAGDELGAAHLLIDEPRYPETRVGGFGLPGEAHVGAERSLSLGAPWACGERSGGSATGSGEFRIFDPSGTSRSASAFGWNRLFQGREHLGFIDAYDFRARVLWPEIGRFGQEDPAGTVDSLNRYQALQGDWPDWTDPLGLYTIQYRKGLNGESALVASLVEAGWTVFWGGPGSHHPNAHGPDVFAYNAEKDLLAFFDDKNWKRPVVSDLKSLFNLEKRGHMDRARHLIRQSNLAAEVKDALLDRLASPGGYQRYVTAAAKASNVRGLSLKLRRKGVRFLVVKKQTVSSAKAILKKIPVVAVATNAILWAVSEDRAEATFGLIDPTGSLGSSETVTQEEEMRAVYEEIYLPALLNEAPPPEADPRFAPMSAEEVRSLYTGGMSR